MYLVVIGDATACEASSTDTVHFGDAQQRHNPTAYGEAVRHVASTESLHGTLAHLYPLLYETATLVDVDDAESIIQHTKAWRLYTDTPPPSLAHIKDARGKACVRPRSEFRRENHSVFTDETMMVQRGVVKLTHPRDALRFHAHALCVMDGTCYAVMDGIVTNTRQQMEWAIAHVEHHLWKTQQTQLDIFNFLDALNVETVEECRAETQS